MQRISPSFGVRPRTRRFKYTRNDEHKVRAYGEDVGREPCVRPSELLVHILLCSPWHNHQWASENEYQNVGASPWSVGGGISDDGFSAASGVFSGPAFDALRSCSAFATS